MRLTGNSVSRGIAMARAEVYGAQPRQVMRELLNGLPPETAVAQVAQGRAAAARELDELIASFGADAAEQRGIFQAHREILQDEELEALVTAHICEDGYAPAYAVYTAFDEFAQLLSNAGDGNIAQRAGDVRDVCARLLHHLQGSGEEAHTRAAERIIVAHDLLPSQAVALAKESVCGFVLESGCATSHTAILARSLGIPALLGVADALEKIHSGDELLLDALDGTLTVCPTVEEAAQGRARRTAWQEKLAALERDSRKETTLADGGRVQIGLNIASAEDEIPPCADFVGLFRTEFLYMHTDHLPTEEEQFTAYREVLRRAAGRPVILRTLDIGGDKELPYLDLPKENNPFLGIRAIRLCFVHKSLFLTQLCAALRASAFGPLKLMFPMIGSIEDIRRAKACVEEAKEMLRRRGDAFCEDIPVGIMIEIPAIALIADLAAREVDFASIGTNDLCQYTCAADRMEPRLNVYNQPLSPAMLRLLGNVVSAFNAAGKEISLCGELAGDAGAAPLLAGLGLRRFSMSGGNILPVKARLRTVRAKDAEECYARAIRCATQTEVLEQLPKEIE